MIAASFWIHDRHLEYLKIYPNSDLIEQDFEKLKTQLGLETPIPNTNTMCLIKSIEFPGYNSEENSPYKEQNIEPTETLSTPEKWRSDSP